MDARLLIDAPAPGAWNMAVDEVLLAGLARRRRPTLRFYGWDEPTVSLGYFQAHADRGRHAPSRDCAWVRRATGGGAIVHDRELTYSVAWPAGPADRGPAEALYRQVHAALIDSLADWNVRARPSPGDDSPVDPPWLCFQRRSSTDVLLDDAKICGSAQRRQPGGVLQHGSVLLARSPAAPELPGIFELTGRAIEPLELARAWTQRLARCWSLEFTQETLETVETLDATCVQSERFKSSAWNEKR